MPWAALTAPHGGSGSRGADWRHPGGRYSSLAGLGDHPVVHVSWNDARAWCRWAGRCLPTAPVRSFRPNDYGLWQMVGNVWEWCQDWFDSGYYAVSPDQDPAGPAAGSTRMLRGGSYLCHDSYCNRYRNAARSSNTPDSSMGNAGFRSVG